MKKIILLTLLLNSLALMAAPGLDSVAFFYRENKVVVLINEYKPEKRLVDFMHKYGPGDSLQLE